MLNIQPDDYTQLNSKVQRILDSPKRLRHMQVDSKYSLLHILTCPSRMY